MIYLTHTRLMLESERTVRAHATHGQDVAHSVCSQLVSSPQRYRVWHARHDGRMTAVAAGKHRDRQLLTLRSLCVQQIHRTALVRYFRDYHVSGARRDATLREFYGVMDTRHAAIAEHRHYLVAASSQICAQDLLELAGDTHGLDLLRHYEMLYGQFFGMFCDGARARQKRTPFLLGALIPEAKDNADRCRELILAGHRLPAVRLSISRTGEVPPLELLDGGSKVKLVRPGGSRLAM